MMPKNLSSFELVFPGSLLCTEEEFAPGPNTQTDDFGNISSSVVGIPVFDLNRRTVLVEKKTRALSPLQVGSTLIGKVVLVKDNAAVIEALKAEKNGAQQAVPSVTIAIPVSRIDRAFVASAKQKFKIGDIIVGMVEKVLPWGIDLGTASPEFGVVKAFCGTCKESLHVSGRTLSCSACGKVEYRKLSEAYLL